MPNLGDVAIEVASAAAGGAEVLVEDRPEMDEPFSVVVDGVAGFIVSSCNSPRCLWFFGIRSKWWQDEVLGKVEEALG